MKPLLWSFSVMLTAMLLFACTDHQDPGAQRFRIKKLTRTLPYQARYPIVSLLGYGANGRLDSIYTYQLPDSAFIGGNLSRLISTSTIDKVVPSTSVSTMDFVYDGNPNPFYGVPLIPAPVGIASPTNSNFSHYTYCGGIDNVFHLSKNNPTSSNIKGYSQTLYQYQYNAYGLPQTRETLVKPMLNLPAVLAETLLFEYEQY